MVSDEGSTKMGAGWVNTSNNSTGHFALSLWPSSTRAELAAILGVTLITPSHSNLTINTDSQAAITSRNKTIGPKFDQVEYRSNGGLTWVKLRSNILAQLGCHSAYIQKRYSA